MYEYSEECILTFLKNQGQLFAEPVAETEEEAEAFGRLYGSSGRFSGKRSEIILKKMAWM